MRSHLATLVILQNHNLLFLKGIPWKHRQTDRSVIVWEGSEPLTNYREGSQRRGDWFCVLSTLVKQIIAAPVQSCSEEGKRSGYREPFNVRLQGSWRCNFQLEQTYLR